MHVPYIASQMPAIDVFCYPVDFDKKVFQRQKSFVKKIISIAWFFLQGNEDRNDHLLKMSKKVRDNIVLYIEMSLRCTAPFRSEAC
jgi:hypothetical protein